MSTKDKADESILPHDEGNGRARDARLFYQAEWVNEGKSIKLDEIVGLECVNVENDLGEDVVDREGDDRLVAVGERLIEAVGKAGDVDNNALEVELVEETFVDDGDIQWWWTSLERFRFKVSQQELSR